MKAKFLLPISALLLTASLNADTFNVKSGWQMLGTTNGISDVSALASSGCVKQVLTYRNGNYQSYPVVSGLQTISSINPGEGFWVNANGSCQVDAKGRQVSTPSFSKPSQAQCTSNGGQWDSALNECRADWKSANNICKLPTKELLSQQLNKCGANVSDANPAGSKTGFTVCMANDGFTSFDAPYYWTSTPSNSIFDYAVKVGSDDSFHEIATIETGLNIVRCTQ